ncbi:shufflon system plasmid conjugative transfer pilus tip adhesin PilV [Serratia sp. Se-RSBMAAmG]|uniref:shufflon system plasmid conjugative transfer pilus tip adhesin PilV n=1 Tax=Serratia sp. Se-RSBMAAmG TaxID=3043305 RepID=UPI0024AF59B7|nr:shufflon system plasmid conjugative transfer pilus tip adhesin PilV [Serratia sp. Se-RSBMAAmG]MDI6976699.1 shufflon system plasmid conjugative transfer pilus tip adhesin PilV [Serratia sp. Se-RSBMAAmG]
MFNKKRKGFSLLELVLVLGVGASLTFIKFQDMIQDQNDLLAKGAGEQIKQLGDAVNGYINIRYDKLSTLASSTSQSSDPGPRTCNTGNNTCTITTATLVNEGLLHSSYSGRNVYQSGYTIVLKRSGTAPNYVIDGLISTTTPLTLGASTIKYDLLGKAMQVAGIDSGMTKSATQADGYNGMWKETSTNFSNINQAGLLTYRTGYNAALYSIYLRRDGTLPMTGNLNMGANDINNAKNITASGTGTFGGNVNAGAEINAKNGYGDAISFGGDAAGNDYEIRLGSPKQLTIYSPNAPSYSTVMAINRNVFVEQRLGIMGYDPNNIPSGWGGGLRTLDVYASGTVGAGDNSGNLKSYLSASGNVYAANNVTSSNTINAGGRITGGDIYSNTETYTNNWFRTMGDGGIYFQKYGGGWNMGDTATINAFGGKNVQTTAGFYGGYVKSSGNIDASGNISGNGVYGNYIHSNGQLDAAGQIISGSRLTTNEYLQINGQAGEGGGCSPNGLVGRSPAGKLLSCTNGVWTAAAVGTPGYYCRLTSFDKGRSDDYVGYTPRTDQNCPVIYPGQAPQGFCSCIKVVLAY